MLPHAISDLEKEKKNFFFKREQGEQGKKQEGDAVPHPCAQGLFVAGTIFHMLLVSVASWYPVTDYTRSRRRICFVVVGSYTTG